MTDANGLETTYSYNALGLVSGESEQVRVNEGFRYYYTYGSPSRPWPIIKTAT